MREITIKDILNIARKKNYKIFYGGRGINLNIWGIRSKDTRSNTFNDRIILFWKTQLLCRYYHYIRSIKDWIFSLSLNIGQL